ncbi:HAMP domain-containing sensor histidine kinase [Limnohabitans sp.]|uniref:sensor histidine kinase n=1 Tax=Limnohabitans sp. TaxID=1907725 RepID=UPI0025BFE19A|nr:HAMP domain-containing sensor histidine kinase [Limnohabitans sp.]
MTINDFNSPFYWVYAFMFLGVAWTHAALFKGVGARYFYLLWLSSTLLMCFASIGLAFLPWVGHSVLGFTSIAIMAAVLMLYLIVRAWRTPLMRKDFYVGFVVVGVSFVVANLLLHFGNFQLRVAFIIFPSMVILCWGLYEGVMLGRVWPSLSHKFLVTTQVVLLLVIAIWQSSAVVISNPVLMTQTGEPVYVAVGRLLVVSLTLVLMVAMVGVAIEKLRQDKEKLMLEKSQSDALNKRLALTLQERNQMLKALTFSSDARNSHALISNLTHEMNQPLGSIRLYADHLLHAPDLPRSEQEEVLRKVVLGSERAQQSLKDFRLFFSSMQDPDQVVRLDVLIREILDLFAEQLADAGIGLNVDIQDNVHVSADVAQLKMVIMNLLSNAMDALYEQPQPRQIRIWLRCEPELACFSIQDTGKGVPLERREKIFESFFSTKENGVGLGLWLCRAIVAFYGGAMSAHLQGPGARFDFNLPLVAQKDKK